MRSYVYALELAAELEAAGMSVATDVRDAAGKAPCLLLTPPALAFDGLDGSASATWAIFALAGDGSGTATSWEQLDELVEQAVALLPIERATSASYVLDPNAPAYPAYRLELSTTLDPDPT